MISHRYRCIFVTVSKVASTSIRLAFKERNRFFDGGEFKAQHNTITYYKEKYPRKFDQYYKFAFVRNPWDRIYSQFLYQKQKRQLEVAQCSFQDWLKKCEDALVDERRFLFARNREIFVHHLTNQLDWLTIDGDISVDFIGRFENLDADFCKICEAIHVDIALPKKNTSKRVTSYKDDYSDWAVELVGQWHSKDLEYFGYSYE